MESLFTVIKFVCVLTNRQQSNVPFNGDGMSRFVAHM